MDEQLQPRLSRLSRRENAKPPPSPRKLRLSRDLSRENAKPGREIHGQSAQVSIQFSIAVSSVGIGLCYILILQSVGLHCRKFCVIKTHSIIQYADKLYHCASDNDAVVLTSTNKKPSYRQDSRPQSPYCITADQQRPSSSTLYLKKMHQL